MDRRMRIGAGCGALALLAALASPARAQEVPGLREAQRVRVTTAERLTVMGTVVRLANDTLAVATPGGSLEQIPWATVRSVDVSRAGPRRTGRFALIGAGIGTALGIAAIATCDDSDSVWVTCADMAPVLIGGGLGIGGLVGALVGSQSRGPERWERLRISPALGLVPTSGGARPYLSMWLGATGGS